MGRRHANEFRADEALKVISADRQGRKVGCPCCDAAGLRRNPTRSHRSLPHPGRVTLICPKCKRIVSYVDYAVSLQDGRPA